MATLLPINVTEALASLERLGVAVQDLTAANQRIAAAVMPIYAAQIPVTDPHRKGRVAGRLRASLRATAGARRAVVALGGDPIEYAGPITFGWPAHNIAPNRWDLRGRRTAEPIAFGLYETEINRLILTIR